MCWTCKVKDLNPQVAKDPVIVYKVLAEDPHGKLVSPCFPTVPWVKGVEYYQNIKSEIKFVTTNPSKGFDPIIECTRGFHSYQQVPELQTTELQLIKLGSYAIIYPSDRVVAKFEIPASSMYMVNPDQEVVSDMLVLKGIGKIVNGEIIYE